MDAQAALDQEMTTSQVYARATMWFIETMRCLAPISIDFDKSGSPLPEEKRKQKGAPLPSWVPDYSRPHRIKLAVCTLTSRTL